MVDTVTIRKGHHGWYRTVKGNEDTLIDASKNILRVVTDNLKFKVALKKGDSLGFFDALGNVVKLETTPYFVVTKMTINDREILTCTINASEPMNKLLVGVRS